MRVFPVAFSRATGPSSRGQSSVLRRVVPVGLRTMIRQWLGLLTLSQTAHRLRTWIEEIQPDIVHAMRIPFEGMLAAEAVAHDRHIPLLVSVWGNDFTLHAPANAWMGRATRNTLQRANAIHTDCERDARLARDWGFAPEKPVIVLPGGGGVQLDIFYPPPPEEERAPLVINPRGVRAYVRNDTFFQAVPLVLKKLPQTRFVCPAMQGEYAAYRWVQELGITEAVELLPKQNRPQMAQLFRCSQIVVSPTTHDGTPNTLLEALACGCFPIAGDIESLQEWIVHGENGFLIDPDDPQALAEAIILALTQPDLRRQGRAYNTKMIAARAAHQRVMQAAQAFYGRIIARK